MIAVTALVAPPTALAAWYCYAYYDTSTQADQACRSTESGLCGCLNYYGSLPGTNIPDSYWIMCNPLAPPGWPPGVPMWCAPRPEPCPAGSHFGPTGCASPALKKTNGHPTDCNASAGNPCNAATGNKFQAETDYRSSDAGSSLVRYYNSQLSGDLNFGVNWTSSILGRHLDTSQAPRVGVFRADGRGEPSTCSNGTCTGDADSKLALTQDAAGYTLTLRDNTIERYNLTGKIVSETSPTGQITNYGFDTSGRLATVTDAFGHTLTFGYNTNNHISTVTDSAGQVIGYTYDINNNLTRVDYPDATAKIYHYNEPVFTSGANLPNHLTGISYVDSTGVTTRYATYAYDTTGKAIRTEHAQTDNGAPQEKFTLAYNSDTQTTVTDPVNMQEVMTFSIINLGVKNLVNKVNQSDSKSVAQTFDANNNLTCRKDEEGRVTTYTYNTTNQRTGMTEGRTGDCANPVSTSATRTTNYQYLSSTLDLPTAVSSPGMASGQSKTTTIQYTDAAHPNLPAVITQSGFTPGGRAVSRTVALGYNAYGQVNWIDGPRIDVADITTLEYYACTTGGACGQLSRVTNALGHTTTYNSYDANGRLLQMTAPDGIVTAYEYNPRGRVMKITRIGGGISAPWQYSYTPWGDVSQVIDPDGVTLNYQYDAAHYLRYIVDAAGNYLYYTYDLKGNRTGDYTYDSSNALKRSVAQAYDLRNRLSSITTGGNVTQLVFDAVGNLTRENQASDGVDRTIQHGYDALNRLYHTADILTNATDYAYDINDKPRQVTAPNHLATQYDYDDLGNLLKEVSPDRNTTVYAYDEAGNAITITDARGKITSYSYDALNRVTGKSSSDAATPRYDYTYDECGAGWLCYIWQDGNTHLIFSYDGLGRRNYQLDDSWLYTMYAYTPGGRLAQITYPDNRTVDYQYDTLGRMYQVSTTAGSTTVLARNFAYNPFGPIKSYAYGNGKSLSTLYDQAYRPTFRSDGTGTYFQNITRYDGADNITERYAPGLQSFAYDAANRLGTATDTATGSFGSLSYRYESNGNSNGNRTAETRNGVTTNYVYNPAGSNWLYKPAAGDYRIKSADGAPVSTTVLGALTRDGYGRLTAVAKPGAAYGYNALDQRTQKTMGGVTTVFHYGPEGELLYEQDNTGAKDYVYLNHVPVARVDNGTAVYYYHTDHLGTPRAMTNSAGTVVWKALYEPFGKATVTTSTVTSNLRLPGMYADSETGLYYNWFRYYDPKIGGYISSDPIGLAGGLNTYRYAYNNPLRWTDPDGLEVRFAPGVSPTFKKQFGHAIQYLNKGGVSETFAKLEKLPQTVWIDQATPGSNDMYYSPNTKTIVWDPKSALKCSNNSTQTPALGLLHEGGHALGDLTGTASPTVPIPGDPYDTAEEKRVIINLEIPVARKLGEGIRTDHHGIPYQVPCPTCR